MRHLLLPVALLAVHAVAPAQIVPGSIDPGMSREQVIQRLGTPGGERTINGFTYLLYENGCERTCGMSDLVTLRGDSVVDAIFRAAARQYTGESSSPVQGAYGRARGQIALEGDPPVRRQRDGRAGSGFALPADWMIVPGAGGAAATVDSIVLQITSAPPPARDAARTSVLPAEWLDPSAAPPPAPARDSAPPQRGDARPAPSSMLPTEWLNPTAAPPGPARTTPTAEPAPPPPAPAPAREKPRTSVLPTEWLDPTAAPAAPPTPQPAPTRAPPPAPQAEKARNSVLPADWLDPNATPAPRQTSAPAARPAPARTDTAKKSLIPSDWLTPAPGGAGARPDSGATRPPTANPPVVPPPASAPPAAPPEGAPH